MSLREALTYLGIIQSDDTYVIPGMSAATDVHAVHNPEFIEGDIESLQNIAVGDPIPGNPVTVTPPVTNTPNYETSPVRFTNEKFESPTIVTSEPLSSDEYPWIDMTDDNLL